jgi:site-specific DNA-adenine methylase
MRYGAPYQGNKSRVADIIIDALPSGNRLVDLFGGGGAITHCGMLSGKWNEYLYNDINPMITNFFMDAVHGKYKNEHRVITREEFNKLKNTDPYVAYLWSFGNNPAKGYLWSKDIEEIKCTACHMLIDETVQERRTAYRKFFKLMSGALDTRLELEPLERLQALESLQALDVSNIDYRDYIYKTGDVVYCDIPYEVKGRGKCKDYNEFDCAEFYEWCKTRPYQVFFSSRDISDNSFYRITIKSIHDIVGATTNSKKVVEYLYSNRPIDNRRWTAYRI